MFQIKKVKISMFSITVLYLHRKSHTIVLMYLNFTIISLILIKDQGTYKLSTI